MTEIKEGTAAIYLRRLQNVIQQVETTQIDHALALIIEAWNAGRQIITFGNGGSALTAQHYITDWNKSIYLSTKKTFSRTLLSRQYGTHHRLCK